MVVMYVVCECGRRNPCARMDEPCKYPKRPDPLTEAYNTAIENALKILDDFDSRDGIYEYIRNIRALKKPTGKS